VQNADADAKQENLKKVASALALLVRMLVQRKNNEH
jgi:hypothetical protein